MLKQTIRIIGGQFRGKKLHFPSIEGLRPTPDRVRETLFNWLMQDIHEACCLDAFAGSGALGFEAFSRGAAKVLLLEEHPQAYASLCKTAEAFGSPKLAVKKTDALDFLKQTKESFNLIFLDPPFANNYLPRCIELLTHSNVLQKDGLLYVEAPQEITLDPAFWQQLKLKAAGHVVYGLYRKHTPRYIDQI
jgi:16S rRNA (guanine966-N2)-methyltransferase